ncbi:MAG: hypothetical protein QOE70_3835 [Chthoniobacter sp.]|jgi:hypothetical protein|nr:hypothetical protein [Chthoniobacter sp.]
MNNAAIAKSWTFVSSKGDKRYQTLLYADGTTSCDCFGWCRRIARDGSRSCKHTRAVLMNTADRECESMHDHRVPFSPPARMPTVQTIEQFGKMGRRKMHT